MKEATPLQKGLDDLDKFESRSSMVPVQAVDNSPAGMIRLAIQRGMSLEQLQQIEKMIDLMKKADDEISRKEFYRDLAEFKKVAPPVKKDAFNNYFKSNYTTLGCLLDTYNPVLGKFGLSVSFPTPEQTPTSMTVECRLSHRLGHQESFSMTAPIDQAAIGKNSGQRSRNPIQDIKSTFTYLRSVTFEAILGVSGTEASAFDDDGNSAGESFISESDATAVDTLIKKKGVDLEKFLKYMEAENIQSIRAKDLQKAMLALAVAKGEEAEGPVKEAENADSK